jgi:glutamyl-tRNA synthetase
MSTGMPPVPPHATAEAASSVPVGRLAPSPTGRLHVGHARTFLLAWWHARSRGGRVVLRIEDLDATRSDPALVDSVRRDVEWLGLDWDGPALVQSDRLPELNAAVRQLVEAGGVYPCVCSRADIRAAQSAPQSGDVEIRYPGTCRGRYASAAMAEAATHRPAGLRFMVPDEVVSAEDELVGPFSSNVSREIGDFLVARRDGAPAYQLAVVVDDADQGVNEVVRGDDLLPSTARQVLLQRALGLPEPRWWHVPLVLGADGNRLAKRDDATSLEALRDQGIDPRSIIRWVGSVSGMDAPERVRASDLIASFSMDRVPRSTVLVTDETIRSLG